MLRAADTVQRTDTGRHRRGNEDSAYARAPVFVLADGMGGARAGEVASRLAIEAFEQGLPDAGTPEERLAVVVQRANREIFQASRAEPDYQGMGTTLTAVMLDAESVALAHVGDSRAYRLRGGELTRLTQDHSLVEELLRDGKLTEDEAFEHPQRSIITRALGQEPIVDVDTFSYPVRAGDVILLCSDGLTDMLPERLVAEVLVGAPSLQRAAQRLIDEANEAGGRDNITVVLFRVEEVPGTDGRADEHTMIVAPGAARAAAGMRAGSGEGARGAATAPVEAPARRAPLARSQDARAAAAARGQRHFGLLGKSVAALVSLLVVVFLVGGGAYLASRQLYFVGTDSQGTLVLYRGFPYSLPFNVPLYETYYVSGVPASLIPADRRSSILNHDLHDQNAGIKLINDVELSKISG
jgi:PPM family protein phosphatase